MDTYDNSGFSFDTGEDEFDEEQAGFAYVNQSKNIKLFVNLFRDSR